MEYDGFESGSGPRLDNSLSTLDFLTLVHRDLCSGGMPEPIRLDAKTLDRSKQKFCEVPVGEIRPIW